MPANVETMFYVREKPWHGLGTEVQEAPTSADALIYAGLDWDVIQKNVYSEDGSLIAGYKVNTRSTDSAALGIVSDRYKVMQNEDAFQFTDDLLGAGVTYETAGALQGGRKVWMLARMPHRYIIAGDEIAPYLVVMNSHDGSSGIKVAMTPMIALGEAPRQLIAQAVGLLRGDLAGDKGLADGVGDHIIGPAFPASLGEVLPLGKQKLRVRDPAVALVAGDQPAAVRLVRILHIVKGSIAIRRSVSLVLARAIKSGETWAM